MPQKYYSPFDETQEVGELEYKALQEDFAATQRNAQAPAPVPPPTTPVASTTGLREEEAGVKAKAGEGLKSLADFDAMSSELVGSLSKIQPYSMTAEGAEAKAQLDTLRKQIGIITEQEQEQIRQAGVAEGAKYDPLIEEARASKRQGLAKAVVAGGERGGFMNTQIAGVSALAPTEGGTFVGSGGELNQIQGIYDRNINNIQAAKIAAISQAQAAARQAIRTGKETDYKLFQDAYDRAQQTSREELALVNEKMQAISNFETMKKARINTALDELSTITATGTEIPEDLKAVLDENYGEGFVDKYKELLKTQQEAASEEELIKSQKTLVDMLAKIPEDRTFKIGDVEYTGMKETDPKKGLYSFTETSANGTVTQVVTRLNPETGKMEIVGQLNLGAIGKPMRGGGGGGDDEETNDFDYAVELLGLNPDASDEELRVQLLRDTDLGVTEINALLENREAYKTELKSSGVSGSW